MSLTFPDCKKNSTLEGLADYAIDYIVTKIDNEKVPREEILQVILFSELKN